MRITLMICTACVVPGAHGFQTVAQTAAPVKLRSRGQRTRELLCSTESQFRYYEEWRRTGKQPQRLIPFDTARAAVQNIGLLSRDEWEEWVTDNKPGITSTRAWFMPNQPDEAYAASGWQGWDDWLGVMLPYDAAGYGLALALTLTLTLTLTRCDAAVRGGSRGGRHHCYSQTY